MGKQQSFTFESFQRWRRAFELGFWPVFFVINTVFNATVSVMDHPDFPAWEPWTWEASSAVVMLALMPALVYVSRRWPIRFETWRTNLLRHLAFSVLFSLVHVLGMVAVREVVYAMVGGHYVFGDSWSNFSYEYLKDVRSYFWMMAGIALYRLWVMRFQGEASLLAEPDVGPPVEPVEQPERFLVRKLGKEFLLAAREIEWLQASANYVNLHVRGRDYPLRATMAGIETRLDVQHFMRVHRSYVINLDFLAEIEPLDTGDARLLMRDGAKIPCSRRYRAALRERFGQSSAA
ncbi:LytTR family DNA-binding domain-containing protein [Dyella acidiphila]|uniref:LytTR family transcriptional regulator n=1 Tax=Dyella acidiphila TaxID=2775866 RepID=A0ABR9G5E0_9GAMM|nr:LytTR family DNA-binding domain-containing protein [Dyella acidiphila]MBE1159270.1 LytTR family transcriptional regulator [Dyella acidiphila]